MVDIHTHILPGLDDGAADIYDTIEMAELAYESGTTVIVATPHCNLPGLYANYFGREYSSTFIRTQEILKQEQPGITLMPGMEVFATEDVPRLLTEGKIFPINRTRYVLLEFDFGEDPDFASELLRQVKELRARPVVAHPERYDFVKKDPGCVREIAGDRVLLQINKGSLLRELGERSFQTADWLVSRGLADLIASDAHDPVLRTPDLGGIRDAVELRYGRQTAAKLLWRTPAKILKDADLFGFHPSTTTRIF